MTCNESDEDEINIKKELNILENKLSNTIVYDYRSFMNKKFLRHRIADLQYKLNHPGTKIV